MVADCARSLIDVERRIPTVVLSANASERPLTEGRVREGEMLIAEQLDGRSVEVEPGVHDFVLELATGQKVSARFVVEEGARLQRLTFDVPSAPASPAPSMTPPSALRVEQSSVPKWLGTAGTIGTAAGLGSIALGTAFGIVAWHERDDANCSARLCDPDPLRRANSAASVATVSYVVGGVLLGLGLGALGLSHWAKRPNPAR